MKLLCICQIPDVWKLENNMNKNKPLPDFCNSALNLHSLCYLLVMTDIIAHNIPMNGGKETLSQLKCIKTKDMVTLVFSIKH